MKWRYNGTIFEPSEEELKEYQGFVYEVIDRSNGMIYIGKKNFWSTNKLQPLKGQKRKRKVIKESDWKTYCGSSKEVMQLVEECGLKRFERIILRLCKTKGEMSYFELKEQMERDVLLKPQTFYNAFVGGKIHRNHLKNLFLE